MTSENLGIGGKIRNREGQNLRHSGKTTGNIIKIEKWSDIDIDAEGIKTLFAPGVCFEFIIQGSS